MNLEDYIKSIDTFLLNEEFAEGTSEDMQNKAKELEAIKAEFLNFLEAIKEKNIDLKTIQAKVKAESGAESTTGEKSPEVPQTSGAPQSGAQPQGETQPEGKTTETKTTEDGAPEAEPSKPEPSESAPESE